MNWSSVLEVIARACETQGEERLVLLAITDTAYHIKEVVQSGTPGEGALLGFVVYADDPDLSKRTDETSLLFVRPEQVLRVVIKGYDTGAEGSLGFGG